MIILGKNTDDVGAQLEHLTKRLLENRRYTNIVTNTLGEGGNEIDVQAEYPSPIPASRSFRKLMAECKAWEKPIALPDWLKFLGKMMVEESKGTEVDGLFVSLSGINGAVRGSFEALRERKQNVNILEGDSLIAEVSSLYKLPAGSSIAIKIKHYTNDQYSLMEMAYYAGHVYWVFKFPNNSLAVLMANGEPVPSDVMEEIKPLLLLKLTAKDVIDLVAQKRAKEREHRCFQYLIASLARSGVLTIDFTNTIQNGYSSEELKVALEFCLKNGWIEQTFHELQFVRDSSKAPEKFVEILRFFLAKEFHANDWRCLANSKWYVEMIDDPFFDYLSQIYGNLPLSFEVREMMRKIVLISPNALAAAINPDPIIVTHRRPRPIQGVDEQDVHILQRNLLRSFWRDFYIKALADFMYRDKGLREIEIVENFKIKDKEKILIDADVKQRLGIAEADESLGGGIIHIEFLENAPEPWKLHSEGQVT